MSMNPKEGFNLLIAGVGGQGTITASHLIGKAALASGLEIIIGEIFGMSMRGGPVVSHVRMGKEALSPITPRKRGDILLGFEPLESLRVAVQFLRPGGISIVNTQRLFPIDVSLGAFCYPPVELILKDLQKIGKIIAFDATQLAQEAGHVVTTNMVMIGALAGTGLLPIPIPQLMETIHASVPRGVEMNLKAFNIGFEAYKKLSLA
jgi:indolepyruvate ferredoxin oxidoreductase, beta subunit